MATQEKKQDTFAEKMLRIQCALTAKKGNKNNFGGFCYRTAEQILESLKPLMMKEQLLGWFHDEKILNGDIFHTEYTIKDMSGEGITTQYEIPLDMTLKGMSKGQMSGASSSYARKYLLCGLFCIDGGDHDLDDASFSVAVAEEEKVKDILEQLDGCESMQSLGDLYNANRQIVEKRADVMARFAERQQFILAINNGATK